MRKIIFSTMLTMASLMNTQAQDAVFTYFNYKGADSRFAKAINPEKEFFNPVLAGFYPDPSICRKGDTYYLVNSSFAFYPGVPIFESKDLVNWQQTGHVLERDSQLQLAGQWVSGGIYAPAISYNKQNDTFYMITTNVGKGNFFVKTKDPHKGWSDPVFLPRIDGIDPSFLFDTDGKAYIVHNAPVFGTASYEGQRAIRLLEFDVATEQTVGEPIEIVRGGTHVTTNPIWIEGPHLYHIGKYYYLMCAEGGTGDGHSEVVFRSHSPKGPWEECPFNPILTQRSGLSEDRPDKVTSTGHADLIQTKEGEWWALFLGCRPYEAGMYNTGRDTYLLPVTWSDGWPVILEKGKAVPTVVEVKNRKLETRDNLLTGNFSYSDRFQPDILHSRWVSLRNPIPGAYTLSDNGLTLHPSTGNIRQTTPLSALFCRQQHTTFEAETELRFSPISQKRFAGITVFQDEKHHILFGKTRLSDGTPALVVRRMENTDILVASQPIDADAPVRLKIKADGRYYSFYYSEGTDRTWHPLAVGLDGAHLSTDRSGGFIGAMIGLYATKPGE